MNEKCHTCDRDAVDYDYPEAYQGLVRYPVCGMHYGGHTGLQRQAISYLYDDE